MIRNNKGFTLMEILITVLIIGVLATMAMPQYFKVVERQKGVAALGTLGEIARAQERFHISQEQYSVDFSKIDTEYIDYKSNLAPVGAVYNTRDFSFVLEGTNDTAKVTARRNGNNDPYSFEKVYFTGATCCKGEDKQCLMFEVAKCIK